MYEKQFRLLQQEGHLTVSSLLGGLNAIRSANIDDNHRGLFYSGLFGLATGFERLMKIVFILEHKINFQFNNPTDKQLRAYGHNLKELYASCSKLSEGYDSSTKFTIDNKQEKILSVLSVFAKGSRYYNLDELTLSNKNKDPIVQWLSVIDDHVWGLRSDVREKLQASAVKNGNPSQWVQNIDGEWITMIDFHYFFQATEKASYHVVWSIINLLNPFYSLLKKQVYRLHKMQNDLSKSEEIPHMYEFFPFLLASKQTVLRKKQWVWAK